MARSVLDCGGIERGNRRLVHSANAFVCRSSVGAISRAAVFVGLPVGIVTAVGIRTLGLTPKRIPVRQGVLLVSACVLVGFVFGLALMRGQGP